MTHMYGEGQTDRQTNQQTKRSKTQPPWPRNNATICRMPIADYGSCHCKGALLYLPPANVVDNVFGRVCVRLFVCLSCSYSNFWKFWPRNFILGLRAHLRNL